MFSVLGGNVEVFRDADGGVQFVVKNTGGFKVSADDWCSIVTAVAKNPDTSETHEAVKAIHGEGPACVTN